jgi:hypothetical protein
MEPPSIPVPVQSESSPGQEKTDRAGRKCNGTNHRLDFFLPFPFSHISRRLIVGPSAHSPGDSQGFYGASCSGRYCAEESPRVPRRVKDLVDEMEARRDVMVVALNGLR